MKIKIDWILPNPRQPRTVFDKDELKTLAESLKIDGLLNPISLEATDDPEKFYLLDGERRWRAATMAGWSEIEANVRAPLNGTGKQDRLFLAMVGNLQRADMGPIDEAKAYKDLMEMGFSVAEIARRVGRSTSNINSKIRMLEFPPSVQKLFNDGHLPMDERVRGSLAKLSWNDQESVAKICGNRRMTNAAIMGICSRILRRPALKPQEKAKYRIADSDCPALDGIHLKQGYRFVDAPIRETCLECGLYADGGVRTICPTCPMKILTKRLHEVNP